MKTEQQEDEKKKRVENYLSVIFKIFYYSLSKRVRKERPNNVRTANVTNGSYLSNTYIYE